MSSSVISRLVQLRNEALLRVSPVPAKAIDLPLSYVSGEPGQCGLASAAMVIEIFTQQQVQVAELAKSYQSHRRYYLDKVGWTHHGLVDLLAKYGIYAQVFRRQTQNYVFHELMKRRLVIVSLIVPEPENCSQSEPYEAINPNLPMTQHLCVVHGYRDRKVLLHDPRNLGIYNMLEVPLETFVRIFSGNGVIILDPIR